MKQHDRTKWGSGPWDNEPDKVQWVDQTTGLPCLAVRNQFGAWCGYVGVSPGHKYFGEAYGDIDVTVHGGLTFAGKPRGTNEPNHAWWLGFDCNHSDDFAPGLPYNMGGTYRTIDYVKEQCAKLAEQLA